MHVFVLAAIRMPCVLMGLVQSLPAFGKTWMAKLRVGHRMNQQRSKPQAQLSSIASPSMVAALRGASARRAHNRRRSYERTCAHK